MGSNEHKMHADTTETKAVAGDTSTPTWIPLRVTPT